MFLFKTILNVALYLTYDLTLRAVSNPNTDPEPCCT